MIESSHAGKTLKLTWDNLNRLIRSDHNGQVTEYGYDVFGRRLYKKNQNAQTLTLFGWDGDLIIWESQQSNDVEENYTKHYVYEPQSFVPLLQTGYTGFIKLLETPDYAQFQHEEYPVYKDPIWKTETRKNKAELERVLFYHCDQVGTPQTLTNELGECVWEIKQDAWGEALEIKASHNLLEQTNIRFQGQYYDNETGLHYNRYRYYESHCARYVSKDPIGLFGGLNNSSYVKDPNQWVDPLGLAADYQIKKQTQELSKPKKPITKKQLSETLGTLGTAADVISIGCAMTVVCAPAAPFIAGVGTGMGALSAVLDDDKTMLQKAASVAVPAVAGKYAGKYVDNIPEIGSGNVSSIYGLYVDKTASAVTDHVIAERNKNTKTPVLMSPAVKIDPHNIPIIPKDPYDFSCLR